MTEIRKRIAALSLAASLLVGTTGCSKNIEKNNSNITQTTGIDLSNLDKYYIVELKNMNNEKALFLTKKNIVVGAYISSVTNFNNIDKDITLVRSINRSEYTSEYGEVINIVPIKQFVTIYSELKENYTEEEIIKVFESVKNDYEEIIKNDKVKKLELKK